MSPTHAPTPCVENGCYNLATVKGRCAQCQLLHGGGRVAYDKRRGSPRERGYDRAWERRRSHHLKAEPFCRTCGKPGNQVDHVIPHRGVKWLFGLEGNLQTLCKGHHTAKTMHERTIPIGMMYPIDLPTPTRPTRLLCGPRLRYSDTDGGEAVNVTDPGMAPFLPAFLREETEDLLTLLALAPRTAERAFWAHVMDCEAEIVEPPLEWVLEGHPKEWWDPYMLDQRAELAIRRRVG